MRSSIIIATFVALAAALPAIVPVEKTDLVVRTESLDSTAAALETRQTIGDWSATFAWPATSIMVGGLAAQVRATNLNNGNYKFEFFNTSPPNNVDISYRISYGGNTLSSVVVRAGQTTTATVPKTGDNWNVYITAA
ncbi:hypothetical protein OPT61_g5229 [Boeremia exigua]|uniref:Uncharacterized protein n=1 Tax=Boeremia exigua TaxID=749465 RepID=A0ACC2IB77_9PLEO|nr:hypothetical protein OPT61_g5229 [Boeremia exigua]